MTRAAVTAAPHPAADHILACGAILGDLLTKAVSRHQAGDLDGALDLCQVLLSDAPGHIGALRLIGVIHAARGKFERATRHIAAVAALAPDVAAHHADLARTLGELDGNRWATALNDAADMMFDQGATLAAARLSRAVLVVEPAAPLVWFNLGATLRDLSDLQGAERAFLNAAKLSCLARAEIEIGGLRLARGDVQGARRMFIRVIHRDPTNTLAWRGLAAVARIGAEPHLASHAQRVAVTLDPVLGREAHPTPQGESDGG